MTNGTRDLGLCFAGGGNRAFWQVGLLSELGDTLFPRVSAVSACSAGSCASILIAAGATQTAQASFARLRRGIMSNFDAKKLLRRERALPHEHVYRSMLRESLDADAMKRLRAAPYPIFILGAEPPSRLPLAASLMVGLAAYQFEKLARPGTLHPTLAPKLGFNAHIHDARGCDNVEQVIDLVLASSATPPFTKEGRFGGARLLDGSLVDNAPAFALEGHGKKTIVLLTRPYPEGALGLRDGRLYLAPTEPVPAHRWDYREAAPVDETIALGVRDAAKHRPLIERYLAS